MASSWINFNIADYIKNLTPVVNNKDSPKSSKTYKIAGLKSLRIERSENWFLKHLDLADTSFDLTLEHLIRLSSLRQVELHSSHLLKKLAQPENQAELAKADAEVFGIGLGEDGWKNLKATFTQIDRKSVV